MRRPASLLAGLLLAAAGVGAPWACAQTPDAQTTETQASLPPPPGAPAPPVLPPPAMIPFVRSNLVLNGVTTTKDGATFITYSRQDKSKGIEVGRLGADGQPTPFPDAHWNSWAPGQDGHGVFVWANALRIGPDGMLWVVDAGAPGPGKDQVPGGAKAVKIDPETGRVLAVFPMAAVVKPQSYVDDIRFNGPHAYLTDAGKPGGVIVLDLRSGQVRRVLDNDVSVTAERTQTGEGHPLTDPQGKPVAFNADQLEVSPDGRWFYYQPATGPFYRIATQLLDDPAQTDQAVRAGVRLWANTGATGGTAMDARGVIYASAVDHDAILRITPDGQITTVIQDPRLVWVDAMWIDDRGELLAPAAQLDRTAGLNDGHDTVRYPVVIWSLPMGLKPLRR